MYSMDKLKTDIQEILSIYKSGNLIKAEKLTEELIQLNPKVAFLYNLLGLILVGQNKNNLAIEKYEKGLQIDPNFAMIYNNLGLLFFNIKNEKSLLKAEEYYKKAISLDKKIVEAYTNLGNLYSYINRPEESIKFYKSKNFQNCYQYHILQLYLL